MTWNTLSATRSVNGLTVPGRRSPQAAAKSAAITDGFESGGESRMSAALGALTLAVASALCAAPSVSRADEVAEPVSASAPAPAESSSSQASQLDSLQEMRQWLSRKTTTSLGDYKLHFRPMDVNVNPRLHDRKPGLMLRGDFLQAELSKTVPTSNPNWTETHGLRGRIHGQIATYGDVQADLQLETFRRWEGSWGNTMKGLYEVSAGGYQDFYHHTTSLGFQMRQELKGGSFQIANQPMSWHIEGNQGFRHRVAGDSTGPVNSFNYNVLLGARRDFPLSVWGHKGTLMAVVGPDIHGGTGSSLKVTPKVQLRARFD